MSFSEVDNDDDGEFAAFLDVFDAFQAAAAELGWSSDMLDEALRIKMKTDYGEYILQVRIAEDDTGVDIAVVYKMTTVSVPEIMLYRVINKCNDVPHVGTFYYREKPSTLIWHHTHILGDFAGMTYPQVACIIEHAIVGAERMQKELLAVVHASATHKDPFSIHTPTQGNA